jgi:folate-binding protein YgfZ
MPLSNQPLHLTHYGLLKVSGSDAKKLLQGQLTCNMDNISQTENSLGALCNPQGRIISLFYIFQWQVDYYLLMPKNTLTKTADTLKKFAVFYKVMLAEETGFYIYGCFNELQSQEAIAHIKLPGQTSRSILVSSTPLNHSEMNHAQWQYLNILDGIPDIYSETSGQFLPHEINLPALNAVSFNKGCYTGQEIIARMHYRAKLKKHLYQATIACSTPFMPGQTIFTPDQQPSGIIVNIHQHSDHLYYALLIADGAEHATFQYGIH